MRSIGFGILALAMALPAVAYAENDVVDELNQAHVTHLSVAYWCKDSIGGLAYFQSARSSLENSAKSIGLPDEQAAVFADRAAEQVRASDNPLVDVDPTNAAVIARCFEQLNEATHRVRVARARIETEAVE